MNTVETFASKSAWLEKRKQGIGGSEVAAILGLDPYKTPYQVWREKRGLDEPNQIQNAYTIAGNRLEKVVVEYFEDETGYVIAHQENEFVHIAHEQYPYMFGSRDRMYYNMGDLCILECKTTQKDVQKDDLPMTWFCQLQWYMGLYKCKKGAIAWLERGIRFDYVEIDFDADFFNYLVSEVKFFWENYVLGSLEPELKYVSDIERKFPFSKLGSVLEASDEMYEQYGKIKEIRSQIKELEEKEALLLDAWKMMMKDSEAVIYAGATLATWKQDKGGVKFDKDKFEKENPQLYSKYCVAKTPTRRFLIK